MPLKISLSWGEEADASGMIEYVQVFSALIGSLAWPIVVLVIIVLFKKEIRKFIDRFRRGSIMGNDIELSEEINELSAEAVSIPEKTKPGPSVGSIPYSSAKADNDLAEILSVGKVNRRMGLISLAIKIEAELRRFMAVTGHIQHMKNYGIREMTRVLEGNSAASKNLTNSILMFFDIRNKIVHASSHVSDEEIDRIFDIGITVLAGIRSVPRETHFVEDICVVYKDQGLTSPYEDIRGVRIKSISPGGTGERCSVFPSRNWKNLVAGKEISWEWSLDSTPVKYFYKDALTGEVVSPTALEFSGRHLDQLPA